jgi:hypothetical protein
MNTLILLCALATNSPKMVCRVVDANLKPIDNVALVTPDVSKSFTLEKLPELKTVQKEFR